MGEKYRWVKRGTVFGQGDKIMQLYFKILKWSLIRVVPQEGDCCYTFCMGGEHHEESARYQIHNLSCYQMKNTIHTKKKC